MSIRGAFEAWTRAHPAKWNLAGWWENGQFRNYTDPDTDYAWMGFEAGAKAGLEHAAKLLDKRSEQLVADEGSYEPDTNVTNLPEWVETITEELEARAADIRKAKEP